MTKVAVLDDYQSVALDMADWSSLPADAAVDVFSDHLSEVDDVASRLEPYDVVVAMRERTPFPRSLLERLPNLRLLVTTGMRNASIDVAAARDNGVRATISTLIETKRYKNQFTQLAPNRHKLRNAPTGLPRCTDRRALMTWALLQLPAAGERSDGRKTEQHAKDTGR